MKLGLFIRFWIGLKLNKSRFIINGRLKLVYILEYYNDLRVNVLVLS